MCWTDEMCSVQLRPHLPGARVHHTGADIFPKKKKKKILSAVQAFSRRCCYERTCVQVKERMIDTYFWQWGSCSYWCLSPRRWRPDRGSSLGHPPGRAGWAESRLTWSGSGRSEGQGGTAEGFPHLHDTKSTLPYLCDRLLCWHEGGLSTGFTFGVFPHDLWRRITFHRTVENSSFAVDAVLVVGLHHEARWHWGAKKNKKNTIRRVRKKQNIGGVKFFPTEILIFFCPKDQVNYYYFHFTIRDKTLGWPNY